VSKKPRIPFTDIARRITGISTPVFGVSWTPPEDKRNIVRRLVTFLEDRRALFADYHAEYGPWVEQSVLDMRAELTEALQSCSDDEQLAGPVRVMRAACRKFLDEMGPFLDEMGPPHGRRRMWFPYEAAMWQALGELRAIFGLHLARLCAAYGMDVEPELASIFPKPDEEAEP